MIRKTKPKAVSGVTFTLTDKQPLDTQVDALEFLLGNHSGEGLYNIRGCRLDDRTALVQTHPTNNYQLCLKVGSGWYEAMTVRADDPQLLKLREEGRLTETGPSPAELEKQRQKDEAEADRRRIEERKHEQRRQVHEERKRKAEEAEARAHAERRARAA